MSQTTTAAAPIRSETRLAPEDSGAWRSWVLAGRALTTALDRTLGEEEQLTLIDFELLTELRGSEEARRMCDLGASVALTRSGATRAITRLEKVGLVRRLPSPTDGRSTVVELTPEGRRRQASASRVFARVTQEHFFALLGADDREVLERTSDLIRRSVMGAPICRSELAG
jgi:DNA-binding MarR family transcriptional regulator